ncbi:hypothetical protein Poli38472_007367 [Pythium oligandrum]|uniref:Poly [ADP-ribose] polymerase n=1 Tax=Pythium oligandrum TaxID=41045 RepID=A0A8K1FGZ5_PYTOL|nr:hypothetical protein Poli38472_007367 [Pythium oligandrum]|eukprot:TMW59222.1 hypothetical protein Poli38472_007367 [Pythium oligandrum]
MQVKVGGMELLRCHVTGNTELLVLKGDLTTSTADAIVNAANSHLMHGGGLAGAIARKGGPLIQHESSAWVEQHGKLDVGSVMSTSSGNLRCKYVIHTVGPNVSHVPEPTPTHAQQLRKAVWSALVEASRLGLLSVMIPGISTGIFGYPRDLGAQEIVNECGRFCREYSSTTVRVIGLMNFDDPTVSSFVKAVECAAEAENWELCHPQDNKSLSSAQQIHEASVSQSTSGKANASASKQTNAAKNNTKHEKKKSDHRAGGVLLARAAVSGVEVLVGVEHRPMDEVPGYYVNFLGGKRKNGERPVDTAAREFSEEVGMTFKKQEMAKFLSNKDKSRELWLPFAKYVLYISNWDTDDRADTLPEQYAKRKSGFIGIGDGAEHECLVWISWDGLVSAAKETAQKVNTPFGKVSISGMLCRFIADFENATNEIFNELIAHKIVESERARIQRLKSLGDNDLIGALLQSDWKLSLSSPLMPPPPPIHPLDPSDEIYKKAMDPLPPDMSSRVVSVRRVNASARIGDYKRELKRIEASSDSVSEKEPLYHGTPERWRATAIALNGFDLSIQLCGRSYGDGVYSSPDVSTAGSYTSQGGSLTSQGGSLLCLRGIVATNCKSRSDNTILPDNGIHVFPNPRCVLPLVIIDFSASDSRDTLEMERKSAQDEFKAMVERRKALEASMKKQEAVFSHEMASRLRHSLQVYSKSFEKYVAEICASKSDVKSKKETPGGSSRATLRQLMLERQQFAACLPIYEVKHEITKILHNFQVVVLTADTGSGKSTQLPQIIMDDVIPRDEVRRIAVLQPRRVNAVSISKRVAEERGLPHGQEVGYRIGRGESNVSETTRVEYMTHGLFVEIARDSDALLNKYCAVVVDEAHERSVDVDLSLALLKRALRKANERERRTKSDVISFRVVVTSATIQEDAAHFQRYLDPSLRNSRVFSVKGCAFPVHIEHRPDIQVDPQVLGSAGVGKVLTSAAIQSAMDILRATETGNILIFLPGEGSINDALETARQDILMCADGEVENNTSLLSSDAAFCFRMAVQHEESTEKQPKSKFFKEAVKKEQKKITVSIIAFHGKCSRAQRDYVLNPPPDQRFVIFSTNVAETGVTLPNVRYVIDTGLERRVHWNAAVDVNEMVTEPVTLSSMKQRTGRAGRTASGICIRLYGEDQDTDVDPVRRRVEPAMQNSMIYKVVLLNKHMRHLDNEELEMLDPIDPGLLAIAEERLHALGALDEKGNLTREGIVLLSLGIDLRLGRFLIACSRFGCLATGTKLASLLVASDGAERLLPHRKRLESFAELEEFVDESGDHLTLLNIVEAYDRAVGSHEGMVWCSQYGFDEDVFAGAELTREYLLKVLDHLKFDLVDVSKTITRNGGIASSLRRALCSAYCDQIAATRVAGVPVAGFTRILTSAKQDEALEMMTDFARRTQPAVSPQGSDGAGTDSSELIVKAASNTTLWLDDVSKQEDLGRLVIFGSQMLTDGSKRAEPTVQLISYVTEEEVEAGAPEWCRLVDSKELVQSLARETIRIQLSDGVRKYVVMDRGAWLKQLRRKFPVTTANIQKRVLVVTCPRRLSARVELEIRKLLRVVEAESVTLQLPDHVKMGKIIGKGGENIKALEENIQTLLSSEKRGVGRRHVESQRIVSVDSTSREITITLVGDAKILMPVIVGRIQSLIVQTHGDGMLPFLTQALGDRGQELQQYPRLAQLLSSVPPQSWHTRDDIMLQIAHALIWKCDVSIYGGFLRDWVIRGEPANDIDVQISPPQTTTSSITRQLHQFLAQSPHAVRHGVVIQSGREKGSAFTLAVSAKSFASIDIDLVDPSLVQHKTHPGVDCDAGNLLLNKNESLRKKVTTAGDSLASALENVRKKQFVFYYPLHVRAPTQSGDRHGRGIDDAIAMMMTLHGLPADAVVGITTVFGNVDVDRANHDVPHILQAAERTDIPVYSGASKVIMASVLEERCGGHGLDGLGGEAGAIEVAANASRKNDAVHALIDLSRRYPGKLVATVLGPMTNITLATLVNPHLVDNVKQFVVMGKSSRADEKRGVSVWRTRTTTARTSPSLRILTYTSL